MGEVTAYIGLGSNLGNRGQTLLAAVKRIDALDGASVRQVSQFIVTEPVGGPEDQPQYLNGAAEITTSLSPRELLSALMDIERDLGRRRGAEARWGPRTCDLDILLMGETVLEAAEVTIPHPRMHERAFVLRPLAAIAPDVVHPVLGLTVVELLVDAEIAGRR